MIKRFMMVLCIWCFSSLQLAWADTYEDGALAQKNKQYSTALKLYHQAIKESDDPRAINALGTMYELGTGVPKDYRKAFEYYNEAAVKGNVKALGNVAGMYERGLGVERDRHFAFNTYFKGLNRGDGKSINNLAVMLATGEVFDFNISMAWAMFSYAIDKGDLSAPANLKNTQSLMTKEELVIAKKMHEALRKSSNPAETLLEQIELYEK